MTKVDFYLLGNGNDDPARYACRLAEKAYRLGHRVYVLTVDGATASDLDELLWTFSQGSFVPHALVDAATSDEHPVLIGHTEPPAAFHDVLVSLASEVPDWFSRFTRIAELVGHDDASKASARERFRFYRERGYSLDTHNV